MNFHGLPELNPQVSIMNGKTTYPSLFCSHRMRERQRLSRLLACFCAMGGCLYSQGSVAQDSVNEQLTTAISALGQQECYRWTTQVELSPETQSRFGSTQGVVRKDGIVHATILFRTRLTDVVIEGDKAAVTNRDGDWDTVSLLDQGYRSAGFAASIAHDVMPPVTEGLMLLSSLTDLHKEGVCFVGAMSSESAESRLESQLREVDSIRDAHGAVRFWMNAGLLNRYQVRAGGTIRKDGEDHDIWCETTTTITDVGAADSELTVGATAALQRPVPKTEPRLSGEMERTILMQHGKRNAGVHDPSSLVKCDSEYWMFSTGNGVTSWRSVDLQTWQRGPRVFPEIPAWVTDVVSDQRGHFWAPDVIKKDGRYLLYYSVSSFGVNTSAIALASTPTLNPADETFHWTDHGIVVQSSQHDSFNAIDPAVIETESGELWMSFGSFWSGLKLIQLDPRTGKRISSNSPMHSIAFHDEIEAPSIYYHNGWYYLFVNWEKCCRGVESTYNVRVGRSRQITGPYLDKNGVDLRNSGGTLLLKTEGPFIGPGHANVFHDADRYWFSCHYYDGTERGRSMLAIQEMTWGSDGWPDLHKQIRHALPAEDGALEKASVD